MKYISIFLMISMHSLAQDLDWQGHRGCRGLLPENSIPAFERALELGVTTLEFDLQVTRDRVVIVMLVLLSTIVAAVGLLADNVAVVIGAMVIAPLLGPNLAQALGVALGDRRLAWRALRTNLAGIVLAVALSAAVGALLRGEITSDELLQRTVVGLDSVTLALASGAAAVLSISTGLPSVLVGVMVAVALLPPAATMGIMLGHGLFDLAAGAALLLAVNVVCVNVAGVSGG